MGKLKKAKLARIEGAARNVSGACGRMRAEGEGAQILLEAARDAYPDALELVRRVLEREAA